MLEGLKFINKDMAVWFKKKGLTINSFLEQLDDLLTDAEIQAELVQLGYELETLDAAYELIQEKLDNGGDTEQIPVSILRGLRDSGFLREKLTIILKTLEKEEKKKRAELEKLMKEEK